MGSPKLLGYLSQDYFYDFTLGVRKLFVWRGVSREYSKGWERSTVLNIGFLISNLCLVLRKDAYPSIFLYLVLFFLINKIRKCCKFEGQIRKFDLTFALCVGLNLNQISICSLIVVWPFLFGISYLVSWDILGLLGEYEAVIMIQYKQL